MTCAPGSARRSSPRVRFAWRTSKPPEPSPSAPACTFTITSSPSATAPVKRGYAMQGRPFTSSRTSPSSRSLTAVTTPRRRLSTAGEVDQLERDGDHALEVGDSDPLVGRVHVGHPVGEVDARQAAGVEDVGIRAAAGVHRLWRGADALHRLEGELDERLVGTE